MTIEDLLRNASGINVTVSLNDLRQLFTEIAHVLPPAMEQEQAAHTLTRKETLQRLGIDSSTL